MTTHDEIAVLVRLAGTSDSIAAERTARVRAAVHDAWRSEVEVAVGRAATRRRWLTVAGPLVVAASILLAFATWGPSHTPAPVPPPVRVGQIDYAAGAPAAFTVGAAVMSGATVATSSGTLAITLTNGVHLRFDASSTARLDSASEITLERGAVYVDSDGAQAVQPGASPIAIRTPAGLVRDIGTQFEIRLTGAGTRIRVREGQVSLTMASGADTRAVAGEELMSAPDGSIDRRSVAVTGSQWEWAERAAPPFSMEGKTLGALLDWVSHEGAWTVTFADRTFANAARATVVHGRPDLLRGLTPVEVLDVVLPTSGLRHRIDGRRVVIDRDNSAGGRK